MSRRAVTIQHLVYSVESNRSHEFFEFERQSSTHPSESPKDIEAASEVEQLASRDLELSSFGVSCLKQNGMYCSDPYGFHLRNERGMLVMDRLVELLRQHWNPDDGYPVVTFSGNTAGLEEIYTNYMQVPLFLPLMPRESWMEWIDGYTSVLSQTPKMHLYGSLFDGCISSREHQTAMSWIKKHRENAKTVLIQDQKYDFQKRMRDWYQDDAEPLQKAAKGVLDEFIFVKKYAQRVPEFLVVPAYHISRYKKVLELLETKYEPIFVMTLPLVHESRHYTILFPVIGGRRAGSDD